MHFTIAGITVHRSKIPHRLRQKESVGGDQTQAEVQTTLGALTATGEDAGRISLTLAVLGCHLTMEIS